MSRLIEADKLKEHYAWWEIGSEEYREFKVIFDQIVDAQPSIDIVRCGECRKSVANDPSDPNMRYCVVHARRISADQFCSYGERPVEGENREQRLERWQREMVEAREERRGTP